MGLKVACFWEQKTERLSCIVAYLGRRWSRQCQILENLECSTVKNNIYMCHASFIVWVENGILSVLNSVCQELLNGTKIAKLQLKFGTAFAKIQLR